MTNQTPKRKLDTPKPSSEAARKRMLAANQTDTKPELELRAALNALGLEFQVNVPVAGTRRRADILFDEAKVAVFVDGCFWHGCPIHGTWPKENAEFWREKIEANRRRDADTNERLKSAGWLTIRVWEHEEMESVAHTILELVSA